MALGPCGSGSSKHLSLLVSGAKLQESRGIPERAMCSWVSTAWTTFLLTIRHPLRFTLVVVLLTCNQLVRKNSVGYSTTVDWRIAHKAREAASQWLLWAMDPERTIRTRPLPLYNCPASL